MKIGVIGSGNIKGYLGKHGAAAGHEILFSSRPPEELGRLVKEAGENTKTMSLTETFETKTDVYILAMPFKAIDKISELYAGKYANSIILNAINPYPERDAELAQKVRNANYNASEYTAMIFSTGKMAKAFNTIRAEHLKDRAFKTGDKLAVPFASQVPASKEIAQKLIEDIRFNAVYVGDLSNTKIMDPKENLYGMSVSRTELLNAVHS